MTDLPSECVQRDVTLVYVPTRLTGQGPSLSSRACSQLGGGLRGRVCAVCVATPAWRGRESFDVGLNGFVRNPKSHVTHILKDLPYPFMHSAARACVQLRAPD